MKASARDSELTAALIEAYNGDEDTKKIARDLGYACARSLCNVWRNMGLSASKRAARTQSEIEAAIFARADAGDSVRAIAEEYGISPRTAQNVILRAYRAEHGPQRISQKMKRAAKPVRQVIATPKPAKVKIKFGFTPAAIKRYEDRA